MEKKIIFQKLTPADDADIKVYDEAMQYIFDNADIKNIAISGSYGAGKSSLIETLKKRYSDKKFLTVSLAHFTKKNANIDNMDNVETVLEGKILNQLIQQIDGENISQTNFNVKRVIDSKSCITTTIKIVTFILFALYTLYYYVVTGWTNSLSESFVKSILLFLTNPYSHIVTFSVAIFFLGQGILYVVKKQKVKNIFRKLSLQGNEIEIFSEEKDSYFDRYLNEVIYLFENAGADSIIFEDIDRFDNILIFERLREINNLVNVRLKEHKAYKNKKRVLRFFYLLRDDMFVNKERTKFFDFIVPIIPVIDNSNSYNKLKDYFEHIDILNLLDDKFLRKLSLYIDDMRVLKNICNEFVIYFYKLQEIKLNPNKMLAMITYKNIFPRDFADLQLNKGFVRELFYYKKELAAQKLKKNKEELESVKKRIEYIKNEQLENIQALEYIKDIKSRKANNSNYNSPERTEYERWCKEEYPFKKQAIRDIEQNKINELEDKQKKLLYECENITSWKLSMLITRDNINEVFKIVTKNEIGEVIYYNELKRSDYFALLKFLIWQGYIDESYNDYMSFFYPNSLSVRDKIFLRSIMDKISLSYDYQLENPELVIENLENVDFEQKEALNYNLLSFLLSTNNKNSYLNTLMQQIWDNEYFDFIAGYYRLKVEKAKFVITLNSKWSNFFEVIQTKSELTTEELHQYSVDTLLYLEECQLDENAKEYLRDFISTKDNFLDLKDVDIEKIVASLIELKVSFKRIHENAYNEELFNRIYCLSMYDINLDNIRLLLRKKYFIVDVEATMNRCLSEIFKKGEEYLYKYVTANMDLLLEELLSKGPEEFTDDWEVAAEIINNKSISKEHRTAYINRLRTKIEELSVIEEDFYKTELVQNLCVVYKEKNILIYYDAIGLDKVLIEFINAGERNLDFSIVKDVDEIVDSFWYNCVICNDLENTKYRMIIVTSNIRYTIFNEDENISNDKIEILIENGIIPMEGKSLVFMREKYPDSVMKYIKENILEYSKIAIGNMVNKDEVVAILSWDIESEIKIKLLSEIESEISIEGMHYSDEIILHIMKYNLKSNDILYLCEEYDKYSSIIQEKIVLLAKDNIDKLISSQRIVSSPLLIAILRDKEVDLDKAIKLLVKNMNNIDNIVCQKCIELLGYNDIASLFDIDKYPRIVNDENRFELMNGLKNSEYLENFKEDEENEIYNYQRGNRIKNEFAE